MRLGFIGDTHGYQYGFERALDWLATQNLDAITQVGDFGFLWPGADQMEWVGATLRERGMDQLFSAIPGNHEYHPMWEHGDDERYLVNGPEMVRIRSWWPNKYFVVMAGGAPSVDRHRRREGVNWWPEEVAREDIHLLADAREARAGNHRVYVTHDAPIQSTTISRLFPPFPDTHPRAMYGYERTNDVCLAHRRRLGRGYDAMQPHLAIHGHYHTKYVEQAEHGLIVGLGDSSQDLTKYTCVWDTESRQLTWPENNKTRRGAG